MKQFGQAFGFATRVCHSYSHEEHFATFLTRGCHSRVLQPGQRMGATPFTRVGRGAQV